MVALVALVLGAGARPTPESGELVSRMFQGSSLCLMALEAQLWSLETLLSFPNSGVFHKGAQGPSPWFDRTAWLFPGLARGTLECMTSGPW